MGVYNTLDYSNHATEPNTPTTIPILPISTADAPFLVDVGELPELVGVEPAPVPEGVPFSFPLLSALFAVAGAAACLTKSPCT